MKAIIIILLSIIFFSNYAIAQSDTIRIPLRGADGASGGTTSEQVIVATASQTAFTFTSVPSSYSDYQIFINGLLARSTTHYTTSGNIVTLVTARDVNDVITFRRIK